MTDEEYESEAEALAFEINSAQMRIAQAEVMQECPYYRGAGVCGSGCYQEPSCQTDEPWQGWAEDERFARARLERLLSPALAPGAWLDREGN